MFDLNNRLINSLTKNLQLASKGKVSGHETQQGDGAEKEAPGHQLPHLIRSLFVVYHKINLLQKYMANPADAKPLSVNKFIMSVKTAEVY